MTARDRLRAYAYSEPGAAPSASFVDQQGPPATLSTLFRAFAWLAGIGGAVTLLVIASVDVDSGIKAIAVAVVLLNVTFMAALCVFCARVLDALSDPGRGGSSSR